MLLAKRWVNLSLNCGLYLGWLKVCSIGGLFDLVEILHLLGFQASAHHAESFAYLWKVPFFLERSKKSASTYSWLMHIRNCSNHDLEPDYARSHISSSSSSWAAALKWSINTSTDNSTRKISAAAPLVLTNCCCCCCCCTLTLRPAWSPPPLSCWFGTVPDYCCYQCWSSSWRQLSWLFGGGGLW